MQAQHRTRQRTFAPAASVYRGLEMVKLQRRLFGEPDNVREVPFGHLKTYDMREILIGRSVL